MPAAAAGGGGGSAAFKWAAVAEVLAAGCSAFVADAAAELFESPLPYAHRDSDVEGVATATSYMARGHVLSVDDAQMGWSRYAQSMVISPLNPSLGYFAATHQSVQLAKTLAARLGCERPPCDVTAGGTAEAYALTEEVAGPAYEGVTRAGVSFRLLSDGCFGTGGGSVGRAPALTDASRSHGANPNAILSSRAFDSREQTLAHGCAVVPRKPHAPTPRPLNWVVPAEVAWPPSAECDRLGLQALCATVGRVAVNREVIAAVSNKNIFHMLQLFVNGIKAAGIPNSMVVALDDETATWLQQRQVDHYVKKLVSRTGDTGNHATSGLKFKILVDFLSVGASVLLSDVDVIWLQNPFPFLYRDSDAEGMSDGWDTPTTYGYDYGGGAYRIFARNSGMFFLQATNEAVGMMRRLAYRMEHEGTWDQTAYNEEQFYPSAGGKTASGVSSRVMPYFCNLNSKTFFRFMRKTRRCSTASARCRSTSTTTPRNRSGWSICTPSTTRT